MLKHNTMFFFFRFGSRITCLVGSLISSVAIFASSYSSSLTMLLLTHGVMGGVGLGLMYGGSILHPETQPGHRDLCLWLRRRDVPLRPDSLGTDLKLRVEGE